MDSNLRHEIRQSFGWSHIANYACTTREQAVAMVAAIRERHPADEARFTFRGESL